MLTLDTPELTISFIKVVWNDEKKDYDKEPPKVMRLRTRPERFDRVLLEGNMYGVRRCVLDAVADQLLVYIELEEDHDAGRLSRTWPLL
jgi:hypothetical protein